MFVQFFRAKAGDASAAMRAMERWDAELRPSATGFLGSTSGITTNGDFVGVARFESEQAARRNSERPEQGEWWAELEKAFAGPATFFESSEVDVSMGGGSDEAGFVQVMVGRNGDREALLSMLEESEAVLREERPDILGGITLWRGDEFIDVAYFTSEAEAREGEAKQMSEEAQRLFERFMKAAPVEEYLDIPEPRTA